MSLLMQVAGITCLGACSNMTAIEASPEEVQQKIMSENILPPGETARIVTSSGTTHKFRVVEVDTEEGMIRGKKAVVPIDDVVAVETKEFSLGKTALLTGATYGVLAIVAIAMAPVFLL